MHLPSVLRGEQSTLEPQWDAGASQGLAVPGGHGRELALEQVGSSHFGRAPWGCSWAQLCRVLPMGASRHQQWVSLGAAPRAALVGCIPVLRSGGKQKGNGDAARAGRKLRPQEGISRTL